MKNNLETTSNFERDTQGEKRLGIKRSKEYIKKKDPNDRWKKGKTHNKIYRKQHTNNTINHEQQQKNCHLKQSVKYICDTFVNVYL